MKGILLTFLVLVFISNLNSQVLKGYVSDEQGRAIPFSKIWIQNTSHGTVANGKGEFQLEFTQSGAYFIQFSAPGYVTRKDTVYVSKGINNYQCKLTEDVKLLEEVSAYAEDKKSKGKRIMKEVIDRRSSFLDATPQYACNTYCFTSLDQRDSVKADKNSDSSITSLKKMNITEWYGTSYFKANNRYKDIISGYTDYSEKAKSSVNVSISFSDDSFGETQQVETNPYIFVSGIADADINIFKNIIEIPSLTNRPIISPLAYNAFVYYSFYLESSFFQDGKKIYEIRVEPKFREEALFYGTLFITEETYAPTSFEFGINQGALNYFENMRILYDYQQFDLKHLPKRREFIYLIKEGNKQIHGNIRIAHSNYEFDFEDKKRNFWLETQSYLLEAYDRDTNFWKEIRPFHLESDETQFIVTQDSIKRYETSEAYLQQQDSIYNSLNIFDFLFNGVGFRNTFKKREIWVAGLINQVVPFGIGGYRHTLNGYYKKEFTNAHNLEISPRIDYGFRNNDLKGSLKIGYLYNPKNFSKVTISGGDVYDFVNNYESIQGTLSPANRVRNRKTQLFHEFEVLNGLYLKTGVSYSNRQSIEGITYPNWVNVFGTFSEPNPFESYEIFMSEIELSYRFGQQYIFKGNKKIVTGTRWPMIELKSKKGFPQVLGGQSDFDYLEFGIKDDINFKTLGETGLDFTAGTFLRKKDLRVIENIYFRTSDKFFFSNPLKSMQLLDTSLNTSNNYLQFNFIHHFNGFFLTKLWLINKLRLEETIGGGLLLIPEANFRQQEFYIGLERTFRIRKQLFKIGCYAVAADNNFDKAAIRYKFGINFYDSFRRKWTY